VGELRVSIENDLNNLTLRVGCQWVFQSEQPIPAVVMVEASDEDVDRRDSNGVTERHRIIQESWHLDNGETVALLNGLNADESLTFRDLYGNRCRRFTFPVGEVRFGYDALIEVSALADEVDADARQTPIELLPVELLHFLLSSRYCPSDTIADEAWALFGNAPLGWGRVQAVCDWIHTNIEYKIGSSTPETTALDVLKSRRGICRDFAHTGIAFCRALGIPARYCFGYLPDVGIEPSGTPMDFHAWFEAWLDGRWRTFDARHNVPRIGRIPIARGRDAVDCALVTTYGATVFQSMTVVADAVELVAEPVV
jgi:transglutaminase-like putative cysteine protease